MSAEKYLLYSLVALAVLYAGLRLAEAVRVYLRYRGRRLVTCPETQKAAGVRVAADGAAGFACRGTGGAQAASGRRLEAALLQGPAAWGFATPLWILPRVATEIWKICRVRYHPHHVWQVLRSLGWTRQRPARRARERAGRR